MKKIGITGKRSTITQEFLQLYNASEVVFGTTESLPRNLDEYLLCAGVLFGKDAQNISDEEAMETLRINFINVIRFCDKVFSVNKSARVCVVGSESGFVGSFDMVYAASKAALHLYVETKKLEHKDQHLVCIAPTIIEDSAMTQRRTDLEQTLQRGKARRLGRWLLAAEVARIAHFALQESALCNSVLRMRGGTW